MRRGTALFTRTFAPRFPSFTSAGALVRTPCTHRIATDAASGSQPRGPLGRAATAAAAAAAATLAYGFSAQPVVAQAEAPWQPEASTAGPPVSSIVQEVCWGKQLPALARLCARTWLNRLNACSRTPLPDSVECRSPHYPPQVAEPSPLRALLQVDERYQRPTPQQLQAAPGGGGLPREPILLYQYDVCPFCCKVKAFLDYHKVRRSSD